jgi:hypothetical protein
MSKTKPFTNMFGSEVQVTEKDYVMRWHDKLFDLGVLFIGSQYESEYQELLRHTVTLASTKWQQAKPNDWAEKAEAHQHDEPLCG